MSWLWHFKIATYYPDLRVLVHEECNFKQARVSVSYPRVRVCGCKLCIPGDGGCNLTGGLTLVNPLLGVLRMMMWAVDPPRWFHFLRASSRSQIEKLWGYYKVRGWLTLNMMTIPCWHFHFLKRLIPRGSWGQRCLLISVQIQSLLLLGKNIAYCKYAACPRCVSLTHPAYPRKVLINMAFHYIHMHEIRPCLSYTNVLFCTFFFPFFFFVAFICPSNVFRGAAAQPTSGSSWCF